MKISSRLFIWYRFTCILYRRGLDKAHHHDHETDLYVSHGKVDGKDDHDADNGDDEHEDDHMALELDILKSITSALSEILENLAPFNLI